MSSFRSKLFLLLAFTWGVSPATGQTNITILKSFRGFSDGSIPWCTLADGKDGGLYGTTLVGGILHSGTVFRINLDGSSLVNLKLFTGPDGAGPFSGLVVTAGGDLFGTTRLGGSSNLGTIFRLAKDGSDFRVLHSFTGGTDGIGPKSALIQGSDGALYGIGDFVDVSNRGKIFRINPDGSAYSIIHNFTGSPDGQQPAGRLLEGSDGRLYGTTQFGGLNLGTVYSLQKDGNDYWNLHYFQHAGGEGVSPAAGLLEGSDGVLYGTASHGGTLLGGTVFRLNKDGNGYATLHNFSNAGSDNDPSSELVEGTDGALYGTTWFGALYKLNKDGSGCAILQTFGGGATPWGLLSNTNGVIYGETSWGGLLGLGSIFALSNGPLPPQLVAMPSSGGTNSLLCAATSGFDYDVLRSTNLVSWMPLTTVTSTNGGFVFPDVNAPQPAVFYRLQRH